MNVEEKSQEQIRFENILLYCYTGEFRSYKFPSLGNIIHWLYVYRLMRYDEVQIGFSKEKGFGEVTFFGKVIATYIHDEERQMPIFTFIDEYSYQKDNQEIYLSCKDKYPDPYEKYKRD